jgi:hypothetical protein
MAGEWRRRRRGAGEHDFAGPEREHGAQLGDDAGLVGDEANDAANMAVNVAGSGTLGAEVAELELVSCGAFLSR